ncbi:MAG: gliding motility-associated C-terminal domain-containing protein [Bacteroidota bacterium]
MKNILLLSFLLATVFSSIQSQVAFQKSISLDTALMTGSAICECPDASIVMSGLTGQIIKLSPSGNLHWARQVTTSAFGAFRIACGNDGNIFYTSKAETPDNNTQQVIVKLNASGQMVWDKSMDNFNNPFLEGLATTDDGGCLTTSGGDVFQHAFHYHKLSSEGAIVFSKSLEINTLPRSRSIIQLASGDYLIGGNTSEPAGLLVKADANGSPLWAKSYSGFGINKVDEFPNGHLLIAGPSSNFNKIVIARLTAQGDLLWAKVIGNEAVSINGNGIATPDGGVLLRTMIEQIMGFIKMDSNGSVQWTRGYPAGNFEIGEPTATQDGGYLFMVPSYTLDSAGMAGIIKTDAEGLLPICEAVDLCVDIEDFAITATDLSWTENNLTLDTTFDTAISPVNLTVEDYCSTVLAPTPEFELPDSLCAGDVVSPSGLGQTSAGSWFWTFEGGMPGSSSTQFPGAILFPAPGQFEVTQTIYFGGCPDSFTLGLTVLPAPQSGLGPDTLLCEDESFLLDGTTPDAISYLWEDGSVDPLREVTQNGIYRLTVSNGYCEGTTSVSVKYFSETYPDVELDLGPDTTLCEGKPFSLTPSLPGSGTLIWDDGGTELIRPVDGPGIYSATFFLENCPLEDEVEISFVDCTSQVYAPNAFSPNSDGVNDFFTLYGGNGFTQIVELAVFDRWGGLVFEARDLTLGAGSQGWDGNRRGKAAAAGVYAWHARVLAVDGSTIFLKGEVHLIR